jgi:hypothetical protein
MNIGNVENASQAAASSASATARSVLFATVRILVSPGIRAQLALLFNATFTRSGVNGTVRSRTPAAS